jgi:hypothetical protein
MRYSGLTGAGINIMSLNNLIGQALRGVEVEARMQRYVFETNWSTGEVVKRGTGSSHGQDGFLRPGFSYVSVVDYLYDKVVELLEIGAKEHPVLSRDWKVRFAAAIVPIGLENDSLFYDSVILQLEAAVQSKFQKESKVVAGRLKISPDLWETISEEKAKLKVASLPKISALISCSFASTYVNCKDDDCFQTQIRAISSASQLVLLVFKEIVDCAIQQRLANQRSVLALHKQPNAVDTFIGGVSGDSQVISDNMAYVIVLVSAASCICSDSDLRWTILSLLLTAYTFFLSYNVFYGAVRYRKRHAYHVRSFLEQNLSKNLKNLFLSMTKQQQDSASNIDPFESALKKSVQKFVKNGEFFGAENTVIQEVQEEHTLYLNSEKGDLRVIIFIRKLIENFIVCKFQENSYIQEDLVGIYKDLLEIRSVCRSSESQHIPSANEAFHSLHELSKQLQVNFLAERWRFETVPSAFRYLCGTMARRTGLANKCCNILHIIDEMTVSSMEGMEIWRTRQDLFQLNQAIREFDFGSTVIVFALCGIFFSLFGTTARFVCVAIDGNPSTLLDVLFKVSMWISVFINIGFFAVVPCLFGRCVYLLDIYSRLSNMDSKHPIPAKLRRITILQFIASTLQLLAVAVAVASILWMALMSTYNGVGFRWYEITTFSLVCMFCSIGIVQVKNYLLFFDLDPCVGQQLFLLFRPTISQMERTYNPSSTGLEMETTQEIERVKWEYVAREFLHQLRFDMILDTNRVGSMFQSLQSGMRTS